MASNWSRTSLGFLTMSFLSLAWWTQKLSGIAAQAIAVVAAVALAIGFVAWLRHDARLDERKSWQLAAAVERNKQMVISRRREREAYDIGMRAEKDLLRELDAGSAIISELEAKLAARPAPKCDPAAKRVICYPKDVVPALNR